MSKVTLLDVAKEVNLSKTTVSMVLNNKPINVSEETRKRIFDAAKKLNYIPNSLARSLSTKKSYTIGFIIPDVENPFFAEMAKAIETEAEKYGYSMILCNTFNKEKKEQEYLKLLISKLIDGVILVSGSSNSNTIDLLKSNDIPVVILDRYIGKERNIDGVFCDNEEGIRIGVEYLINKKYKNIAFVGGNKKGDTVNSRLNYFCEIAKEHGVFNEDLVVEDDISLEGGINAATNLISKKSDIDVIFYSSDIMAIGGMKYLLRQGYSIPHDIAVLGYDNIGICSYIEPELTTIAQPIYKMGQESCRLLMDKINNKSEENRVINLSPYLVERRTIR